MSEEKQDLPLYRKHQDLLRAQLALQEQRRYQHERPQEKGYLLRYAAQPRPKLIFSQGHDSNGSDDPATLQSQAWTRS